MFEVYVYYNLVESQIGDFFEKNTQSLNFQFKIK